MNFSDILFKIKKTISLKSKDYIKWLRKKGVSIGNGVNIYNAKSVSIDTQYPFLVSIGDNVNITEGVTILTHDYSWSTIKATSGELLGDCGKVSIGNNVFVNVSMITLESLKLFYGPNSNRSCVTEVYLFGKSCITRQNEYSRICSNAKYNLYFIYNSRFI